jgi:hypothetical protein
MGKLHNFLEQFDGYVIIDLLDDILLPKEVYNRKYHVRDSKDVRIWDVEFTLTSGETRNFYVKARNKQEALEKAESYSYLADINNNWEHKLLP